MTVSIRRVLMISAMLTSFSVTAHAEGKLTEEMVREYYKNNIEYMKKPYDEYKTFMNKSFHENYSSQQTVTLTLPGQAPAKNNVTQNKQQVMEFTPEAHEIVRKSDIQHEVKEIKIDTDINTARVVDHTKIKATLASKEGPPLSMETDATCNDVVTLEGDHVQMLQSKCEANTKIEPQKDAAKAK